MFRCFLTVLCYEGISLTTNAIIQLMTWQDGMVVTLGYNIRWFMNFYVRKIFNFFTDPFVLLVCMRLVLADVEKIGEIDN